VRAACTPGYTVGRGAKAWPAYVAFTDFRHFQIRVQSVRERERESGEMEQRFFSEKRPGAAMGV